MILCCDDQGVIRVIGTERNVSVQYTMLQSSEHFWIFIIEESYGRYPRMTSISRQVLENTDNNVNRVRTTVLASANYACEEARCAKHPPQYVSVAPKL